MNTQKFIEQTKTREQETLAVELKKNQKRPLPSMPL